MTAPGRQWERTEPLEQQSMSECETCRFPRRVAFVRAFLAQEMAIARGGFGQHCQCSEHKGSTNDDLYRNYRARLVGQADRDLSGREPALQGRFRMRHRHKDGGAVCG